MSGYKPGSAQFGSIGAVFGEKSHTQTVAEMPSHTHIQTPHDHSHNAGEGSGSGAVRDTAYGGGDGYKATYYTPRLVINATTAVNQYTGSGQAFNVIQPTLAVLVVIKT